MTNKIKLSLNYYVILDPSPNHSYLVNSRPRIINVLAQEIATRKPRDQIDKITIKNEISLFGNEFN